MYLYWLLLHILMALQPTMISHVQTMMPGTVARSSARMYCESNPPSEPRSRINRTWKLWLYISSSFEQTLRQDAAVKPPRQIRQCHPLSLESRHSQSHRHANGVYKSSTSGIPTRPQILSCRPANDKKGTSFLLPSALR